MVLDRLLMLDRVHSSMTSPQAAMWKRGVWCIGAEGE